MTKYHKCQYRQCKWYDLIKLFHNSTSKLILFIKWKIASSFDYCGGCLILRDFLRSQNRIIMEGLIEAMPHSVRLPAERRWLFLYMYLSHSLEWSSSSALCKTCLHGVLPLSSVTFPRSIITVCVCVYLWSVVKVVTLQIVAVCDLLWPTAWGFITHRVNKRLHTHTHFVFLSVSPSLQYCSCPGSLAELSLHRGQILFFFFFLQQAEEWRKSKGTHTCNSTQAPSIIHMSHHRYKHTAMC